MQTKRQSRPNERGDRTPIRPAAPHRVSGRSLLAPYPQGMNVLTLGMGCFWGVERLFWRMEGVWVTAAGYAGGTTPAPTYREVCSGQTGHAEVVRVVHDPVRLPVAAVLRAFWEGHDPTQGMRQGNDVGTQYRSAIYVETAHDLALATASRDAYAAALIRAGRGPVTTEIRLGVPFHFAEDEHQQYLDRVPWGYCGLDGTGVSCPDIVPL